MAANPSFVFSYLPSAAKASVNSSAATLADQTSAFFQSASNAIFAPRLSTLDQRLLTLQQTKQHLEEHVALKVKAGMSVNEADRAQLKTIEKALAGLAN